jgi:hypothetical protein
VVLAARFGFDRKDRLSSTLDAVRNELSHKSDDRPSPWLYRYSGAEREGMFLACTFWLEAYRPQ